MIHNLSIFTQHGQFYIADKDASWDTGSSDFWNDQAFDDRLAIENGILGVSIENDEALTNIEVEVLLSKPKETQFSSFDHVVDGSLLIGSGKLQILDCPNSQVELELTTEPGWYRVRVGSCNLADAYHENRGDKYYIKIWSEDYAERTVLKRWYCN